jgi:hypothetical protein
MGKQETEAYAFILARQRLLQAEVMRACNDHLETGLGRCLGCGVPIIFAQYWQCAGEWIASVTPNCTTGFQISSSIVVQVQDAKSWRASTVEIFGSDYKMNWES